MMTCRFKKEENQKDESPFLKKREKINTNRRHQLMWLKKNVDKKFNPTLYEIEERSINKQYSIQMNKLFEEEQAWHAEQVKKLTTTSFQKTT